MAVVVAVMAMASPGFAQNKYDVFVGQYMAANAVAAHCEGLAIVDVQGAGDMAKTQDRLRRQKTLRLLHYGKTDWLTARGEQTLAARGVSADRRRALCDFGTSVAGKEDPVGRFLRRE